MQQQQLLNRQWLPPATHARTHSSSSPPLPHRTGPTHPRSPPPGHLRRVASSARGTSGSPAPSPPGTPSQGARAVNFFSSGLGTPGSWAGAGKPFRDGGGGGAPGTVWNRAVTRVSSSQKGYWKGRGWQIGKKKKKIMVIWWPGLWTRECPGTPKKVISLRGKLEILQQGFLWADPGFSLWQLTFQEQRSV